MSSYSYRKASEKFLREKMSLDSRECRIMYGPEPLQMAAAVFVSIHEGDWRNIAGDRDHRIESFSVLVTVSIKAGQIPLGRWGEDVTTDQDGGIDFFCRRVVDIMSGNYDVMNLASNLLIGPTSAFYRPVSFSHSLPPVPRSSAWWGAKESSGDFAGLSQTLVFIDGERGPADQEFAV